MKRVSRRLLLKLRSRLLARFPAGTLRRGSPPSLPIPSEPDPSRLLAFPGERDLPEEIRDEHILRRALAWRRVFGGSDPLPATGSTRPLATQPTRRVGNVLFVSHCDFTGNSAYHVHAIASELQRRGLSPAIAIPGGAYTVEEVGETPFPVLTYRQVRRGKLRFADGRGPDLVHAFTPRERVRRLTVDLIREHRCPYVVHLEDHDEELLSAALGGVDIAWLRSLPSPLLDGVVEEWQSHPQLAPQFLDRAAGATVVIERLLEFVPSHVPSKVILAGFDEGILAPHRTRDAVRADLRLTPEDLAIVYPGHVHTSNLGDLRNLWQAVANLRQQGRCAVLVKTGWSARQVSDFPDLGEGLRDLGWVPRSRIAELLPAGDVLVQPGGPDRFNDYRLPSKVPEFLASGTPVVMPRSNVGLLLEAGVDALLLECGDAEEITAALGLLADDTALRSRMGAAGRAFAVRELSWTRTVDRVEELYGEIAKERSRSAPLWAITSPDPPVKLLAVVDRIPASEEVRTARAHGIFGFCLRSWPEEIPDAPFCVVGPDGPPDGADGIDRLACHPNYLRSRGAPLVLRPDDPTLDPPPRPLSESGYRHAVEERLAAAGPMPPRFVSLFPPDEDAFEVYETWLRKLVLQAIVLAPLRDPIVFLSLTAIETRHHSELLERTLKGLSAGAVQAYATREIEVSRAEVENMFRME